MPNQPSYWSNPTLKEHLVTVTRCRAAGEVFEVGIKENVVRPEGGGQAGDQGTLLVQGKRVRFIDTVLRDGETTLVAEQPVQVVGATTLEVDMEWRKAMMRNHTAEHIFVGSLRRMVPDLQPGYIWIDGRHGTVEVTGRAVTIEQMTTAEAEVQRVVSLNVPVTSDVVSSDSLDPSVRTREGVTSKHDMLRVVRVGEFDSSACSGTHVLNSGDIGFFKVIDYKLEESGARFEFMAGDGATELASRLLNMVLMRKHDFPFEYDQLGAVLDRAKTLLAERNELLEGFEQIMTERPLAEDVKGIAFFHEYLPGFDTGRMKHVVKKISLKGPTAMLLFSPGEKCNIVFAINELRVTAEEIAGQLIRALHGKGGGSRDLYTGGLTGVRQPRETYEQLVGSLRQLLSGL